MSLKIKTFSNATGGNSAFKALGHPLTAPKAQALLEKLKSQGPIAIYDPLGLAVDFDDLYGFSGVSFSGIFIQNLADLGRKFLGQEVQPVTSLPQCTAKTI